MLFKKGAAINAYGHCFVLFEAKMRDLSIYNMVGNETAAHKANVQPYHALLPKIPALYKNNPPQELVIREVVGDYYHSEDQKIGDRQSPFVRAFNTISERSARPKHVFPQLKDAQTAATKIAKVSETEIPVRYEFLDAELELPGIVCEGNTMFCFHRDVTKYKLEIMEYLVTGANFTTDNQSHHLTINAEARDGRDAPTLYDQYSSPGFGAPWQQYKGEDINEDGSYAFRELESFFTREEAEKGLQRFAQLVQRNLPTLKL